MREERPLPSSLFQFGPNCPEHPTIFCVSEEQNTYWGSKTSLMRARRLLSESTFNSCLSSSTSWFTSKDVVSESNRKLKSLHSTWKKNKKKKDAKNITTWREIKNRMCNWRNSSWCGRHTYHFGFEPKRPKGAWYNQQPKRKDVKDLIQIFIHTRLTSTIL